MKKPLSIIALALAGICKVSFGAVAIELSDIGVADASADVVLGEWHGGFDKCLEKADNEHIPMFAMWSNTGCSHCEAVYTTIVTERFVNWRRGTGSNIGKIILLLMKGGSEGNGYETWSEGYDWAWGPGHTLGLYPFTVMYWNKGDGTVIREHNVGERLTGYTGGEIGCESLITWLETTFADWKGVTGSPTSGSTFIVGTKPASRLEAEVGTTTYVDIPLARTNGVFTAGTNYLTATFGGATIASEQPVIWLDDEETTMARLSIKGVNGAVGDVIELSLADDTVTNFLGTSTITFVENQQGTIENPLWFGERTAGTLAAGEWTMDLNVATNRTARQSGSAYTLVAAVGSLWCPDCKRLATNLTDKAAFTNWAKSRNVALVQVDAPYGTGDGPTLLTYTETWNRSGAGYLSRKMADPSLAAYAFASNRVLYTETWNNIYSDGRSRIKLPTLLLMDKAARVVARIDDDTLSFDPAFMIQRLDEMIDTAADQGEENNAQWFSTGDKVSCPGTKSATVSAVDKYDYYKIEGKGRVHATLSPADGAKPGQGWLRIVDASGVMLDNAAFAQGEEASASADMPADGAFVYVSADISSGSAQSFSSTKDTTFPYILTLRAVNVLAADSPDVAVDAAMRKDGFLVAINAGAAYHFEGIDDLGNELSKILRKSEATGPNGETLYQGLADADVFLPVAASASKITATLWQSGNIVFTGSLARNIDESLAYEGAVTVTFNVLRTGGTSGNAKVAVKLSDESTCLPIRYGFAETQLSWANGEDGEKEVSFTLYNDGYYDELQTLVFELKPAGSGVVTIPSETAKITFTILDDDSPAVGWLAVTGATPGFSSKNKVVAAESTDLRLTVCREGGVTGDVAGTLVMLDATGKDIGESCRMTWKHREDGPRTVTMTLPAYLESRRVYVKIVPEGGVGLDYERYMVTVDILPSSMPSFSQDAVTDTAWRYVEYSTGVPITGVSSSAGLQVTKTTGSLPPGMTGTLLSDLGKCGDSSDVVFSISGIPSRTGIYKAVYRISQTMNGNTLRGGTLLVELNVETIPTTEPASQDSAAGVVVPNPAIAKARTFRNLPVAVPIDGDVENATGRLVGLLTLTIPPTGRASAKFTDVSDSTTVFSSRGWTDYNPATGQVAVELDTTDFEKCIEVTVNADGSGTALIENVDGLYGQRIETAVVDLTDAGRSAANAAGAWAGRYTVQMPQGGNVGGGGSACQASGAASAGDAVMTLKMSDAGSIARGRVIYAGYLPDGRSVSGSSVLMPSDGGNATMPFIAGGGSSLLAGALEIKPNAATLHRDAGGRQNHFVYPSAGLYPYWRPDSICCGWPTCVSMDVYGGYYDGDESLLYDCCLTTYGDTNLVFSVIGIDEAGIDFTPVIVGIGENSVAVNSPAEGNPNNVRLSFSRETGLVSGTFRAVVDETLRVFNFRCVMMPGWGGCSKCGPVLLPRPVGSGTSWYTGAGGGKSGFAVKIDLDEEE